MANRRDGARPGRTRRVNTRWRARRSPGRGCGSNPSGLGPAPPPLVGQDPEPELPSIWDEPGHAHEAEPAPWEAFEELQDARELVSSDPLESPLLKRQREMEERLAQIKRETVDFKDKLGGARETQRRLERRGQADEGLVPLGSLRSALKDKRQVKRAVVLREIIGKPLGMRRA